MESPAHRRMKNLVRRQLENEEYNVVEEPLFPPAKWISWSTYRPDLLGYRETQDEEELAIVECETRPSMNRFRSKNYASLWFQPELVRAGTLRRILAVPRGRLKVVDMGLRREWEIWVLGEQGVSVKLPRLD